MLHNVGHRLAENLPGRWSYTREYDQCGHLRRADGLTLSLCSGREKDRASVSFVDDYKTRRGYAIDAMGYGESRPTTKMRVDRPISALVTQIVRNVLDTAEGLHKKAMERVYDLERNEERHELACFAMGTIPNFGAQRRYGSQHFGAETAEHGVPRFDCTVKADVSYGKVKLTIDDLTAEQAAKILAALKGEQHG